ncbi:hypothetical protein GCM10007941_12060 [Amphritea balenae]|nr:hypothetical protein GCM10007941_12060 [Amphritea balenae]
MEAWVKISKALSEQQPSIASDALGELRDELVELESEEDLPLVWPLQAALNNRSLSQAGEVFNTLFLIQIRWRLGWAREQLDDYQVAKVHVAKSKLYLDMLMNDADLSGSKFSPDRRQSINRAMQACFEALGSPGLFGSGQQPASLPAFDQATDLLIQQLTQP